VAPFNHDRNPECIEELKEHEVRLEVLGRQLEVLPELALRLAKVEEWVSQQNGTLKRVAERVEQILQDLAGLRQHSADFEKGLEDYRVLREQREQPADEPGKIGLIKTVCTRYPLGTGILLGLLLGAVLVLGSDWLRGSLDHGVQHLPLPKTLVYPTPTPGGH